MSIGYLIYSIFVSCYYIIIVVTEFAGVHKVTLTAANAESTS